LNCDQPQHDDGGSQKCFGAKTSGDHTPANQPNTSSLVEPPAEVWAA